MQNSTKPGLNPRLKLSRICAWSLILLCRRDVLFKVLLSIWGNCTYSTPLHIPVATPHNLFILDRSLNRRGWPTHVMQEMVDAINGKNKNSWSSRMGCVRVWGGWSKMVLGFYLTSFAEKLNVVITESTACIHPCAYIYICQHRIKVHFILFGRFQFSSQISIAYTFWFRRKMKMNGMSKERKNHRKRTRR